VNGLYSLRRTNASVRLAAVLFMLLLGYGYSFAFLMVRDWAGLTPSRVSRTYAPAEVMDESMMPEMSESSVQSLDLGAMPEEVHTVDTSLLIQDSHIHIMIYALIAAIETLLILGMDWTAWWRNTTITAAFGFGALDFAGQWLMKAGLGGFAWLTIASGWGMSAVYLVVLIGTLRAAFGSGRSVADATS
jgi:hypothetical protein